MCHFTIGLQHLSELRYCPFADLIEDANQVQVVSKFS